jgi:hypothetical protein
MTKTIEKSSSVYGKLFVTILEDCIKNKLD